MSKEFLEKVISLGYTANVWGVALSADGLIALSSSADHTARVWDANTGRCLTILKGHTASVLGVALSADGLIALSGSADHTARVWDANTGRCLTKLEGHIDRILGVALSADGRLALSGSADHTARVWDVDTGRCLTIFKGHTASVLGVALSADGRLALSSSADHMARVWDVNTSRCLTILKGHTARVWGIALSADGLVALSGSDDNTARVWDLTTGDCFTVLEGHIDSVLGVALSADGLIALTGSGDRTARVWDLTSGLCVTVLEGHTNGILGVALSADGWFALSGSDDNTARVWDLNTGDCFTILEGHTHTVSGVALSADGRLVSSSSADHTARVWDVNTGRCLTILKGHTASVLGVALSADGLIALSGSNDHTARVWDVNTGHCLTKLEGHIDRILGVALSADGRLALSGSADHTARVWDVDTGRCLTIFKGHTASVLGVALSADGRLALSGSADHTARVWDVNTSRCLTILKGHTASVLGVALSADGLIALSGSDDNTARVWDITSGRCLTVLEGHTESVSSVALSADGEIALSGSYDNTVGVWDLTSGRCLTVLDNHTGSILGVALTADGRLALSASVDGVAQITSVVEIENATAAAPRQDARYTNAKVVLVGESGVGKTGLALRLCEDYWQVTESTHGMVVSQLKFPGELNPVGIEREVWLWDFAGQPDYRLINQLYMDETSLGLLVFDPQSDNPFEDLGHWEKALNAAARNKGFSPSKLLVAGRCDRGGITVSRNRFEEFCREHGCVGLYLTGAKTGDGCEDLKAAIAQHIPWDKLPYTATTKLFKSLKDALLKLKEEDTPLIRLPELRHRLQATLPDQSIQSEELRTVVGLMQGQGIVQMLDFGEFVLLQPERINLYASVVVRMAREHVDEMGIVPEQQVLDGSLDCKDMQRLSESDEKILLRAMVQTFLDRALCLRENTPKGTMLVFPSYFRRDKPEILEYPNIFVTYSFIGALDEIYATLVVKLSYSGAFEKYLLWKDAADFKTNDGKRVGLAMRKKAEGAAELVIYFEAGIPDNTKVDFIKYVHEHLLGRAQDVTRIRTYVCPHCDTPVENRKAIQVRLNKGLRDIVCSACEERVALIDLIEEKFASDEFRRRVRELEEKSKINLDNESRELILVGHSFVIAGEAGQIFRPTPNSDWGIDGEIEFKDYSGNASGKRLYLQLKSGDSYLYQRKRDSEEVFTIKNERWAEYWQAQAYPVMLVIRTSDGKIRWMNVTEYLKRNSEGRTEPLKQIIFDGEPFNAENLQKMRQRLIPPTT